MTCGKGRNPRVHKPFNASSRVAPSKPDTVPKFVDPVPIPETLQPVGHQKGVPLFQISKYGRSSISTTANCRRTPTAIPRRGSPPG